MTERTTPEPSQEIPYGYCHCGCGKKTRIATRNHYRRGILKGQPTPFAKGHNHSDRGRPMAERFWKRVAVAEPHACWLWTGPVDGNGYGLLASAKGATSSYKQGRATRISYELHSGPIPNGMIVCHHCDNPTCVNPAHLFLGTPTDNTRDMTAKNRQARGAHHSQSRLTTDQVRCIRHAIQMGESQSSIALRFNIHQSTVSDIATGRTWNHLE